MSNNSIRKVAIVGASGNLGTFITHSLLQTSTHTITALTRSSSTATFPPGVEVRRVDYDHPETLVHALTGQDALVITLSGSAVFQNIENKLILAAAEAGVPWILPNEWSPDSTDADVNRDVFLFQMKADTRTLVEEVGKSRYVGLCTGFWYEYSLAISKNFGFNFSERKVTFYDDGSARISVSTWKQIGRAVAALLSLPITHPTEACLDNFANKVLYISSFTLTQRDMLASACRVTGTREEDWTITSKTSREMYDQGMRDLAEKNFNGTGNFLYGRVFFPDGCGDFEGRKGTLNGILGLEGEDLDEATRRAVERQRSSSGEH